MEINSTYVPSGWPKEYLGWMKGIYLYISESFGLGQPVYLNAEPEDLMRMAELGDIKIDGDVFKHLVSSLSASVVIQSGAPQHTFKKFASMKLWKREIATSGSVPPFLPVLLLTVVAAEQMRSDENFISTNYYGRLATLIGYESSSKDRVGQSYREYIAPLWELFNDWLKTNPDLGIPTALLSSQNGYFDYVGVPIGQALLRSNEQEQIEEEFFEKTFNEQGIREDIEYDEFIENLEIWMSELPGNSRIRKTYENAKDILRNNIWFLYERWEPKTTSKQVGSNRASLRLKFTLSKEIIGYVIRMGLNANLNLTQSDHVFAGMKIAGGDSFSVELSPDLQLGSGSSAFVGNHLESVLSNSIQLSVESENSYAFKGERAPRGIIPFIEESPYVWVEEKFMKLGEVYWLIVPAISLDDSMALFNEFGEGAQLVEIIGLPEGWRLIRNFRPLKTNGSPDNLPLKRVHGPQLRLIEGTKLVGSKGIVEYPAHELPTVQILQLENDAKMIVRITNELGVAIDLVGVANAYSLGLLDPGQYMVNLFDQRKAKQSLAYKQFVIRSSANPRHLPKCDGITPAVYQVTANSIVTRIDNQDDAVAVIQGARLVNGKLRKNDFELAIRHTKSSQIMEGEEDELPAGLALSGESVKLATCVTDPKSTHLHTVFETIPPRRHKRFQSWTCKNCGVTGQIDTRLKKKPNNPEKFILTKVDLPTFPKEMIQPSKIEQSFFDRKTIEERLWALGGGGQKEATLFSGLDENNYVSQVMWKLAVSGHIDISDMEYDLSVGMWRVTPTVLFAKDSVMRLIGNRSSETLNLLEKICESSGGKLVEAPPSDRSYLSEVFYGFSSGDIPMTNFIDKINHHPELINVVSLQSDICNEFIFSLPTLSQLKSSLKSSKYSDNGNLTKLFNVDTNKWADNRLPNLTGNATQDSQFGASYHYVVEGDAYGYRAIRCGYRLAKHFSAHSKNRVLFSYNEESMELLCPLGAELPLLYSRGITFISSVTPNRRGVFTVYSGVDSHLYQHIENLFSN